MALLPRHCHPDHWSHRPVPSISQWMQGGWMDQSSHRPRPCGQYILPAVVGVSRWVSWGALDVSLWGEIFLILRGSGTHLTAWSQWYRYGSFREEKDNPKENMCTRFHILLTGPLSGLVVLGLQSLGFWAHTRSWVVLVRTGGSCCWSLSQTVWHSQRGSIQLWGIQISETPPPRYTWECKASIPWKYIRKHGSLCREHTLK